MSPGAESLYIQRRTESQENTRSNVLSLDSLLPPRRVVGMALEQIRAFIEVSNEGRVQYDGTVSHIANPEQVAGVVEGFLTYLLSQRKDAELKALMDRIRQTREQVDNPQVQLNEYIRILAEWRNRLPAPEAIDLSHLAQQAEEELLEEALSSPYLVQLPSGNLVGEAGSRTERALLEVAHQWLEQMAWVGAGTQAGIDADSLKERAANAYTLDSSPGARMSLINQILMFWRSLHFPGNDPGRGETVWLDSARGRKKQTA